MHKVSLIEIISPLGKLIQSHQITFDGLRRNRNVPNLSETVDNIFESYRACAVRGIKEELALKVSKDRLIFIRKWKEIKPSPTTHELKQYEFCLFRLSLSLQEANACKLIAYEGDCTTYFKWEKQ